MCKILFYCTLLVALWQLSDGLRIAVLPQVQLMLGEQSCPNNCLLQYRCTPYVKSLVWSLVDGKCRVYQNGCIFASENCSRVNKCKSKMEETTQELCQRRCNYTCIINISPVCASFPSTNGSFEYRTFNSRCLLEEYACKNARAYVGEPVAGSCKATL